MNNHEAACKKQRRLVIYVLLACVGIVLVTVTVRHAVDRGSSAPDTQPVFPQRTAPARTPAASVALAGHERESPDDEIPVEIHNLVFEVVDNRLDKLERENYIRERLDVKSAIPPFSPVRDPLELERQRHLKEIGYIEKALPATQDIEKRTLLHMDAAMHYQGMADLTIYKYDPEQHTEYQQAALDHIWKANSLATEQDAVSLAYHVATYVKLCMRLEHSDGITLDGTGVSWQLALDWYDKAESMWQNTAPEKRNPRTTPWYPPSSLRARGECLMALGRTGEALELFDELREKYPDHAEFTSRLKQYLQQPHTRIYYSRYYEE